MVFSFLFAGAVGMDRRTVLMRAESWRGVNPTEMLNVVTVLQTKAKRGIANPKDAAEWGGQKKSWLINVQYRL